MRIHVNVHDHGFGGLVLHGVATEDDDLHGVDLRETTIGWNEELGVVAVGLVVHEHPCVLPAVEAFDYVKWLSLGGRTTELEYHLIVEHHQGAPECRSMHWGTLTPLESLRVQEGGCIREISIVLLIR
jgi:hypothetical protein